MSEDLIATALRLAKGGVGRPRRSDLERAVSSAYYALFHAVAEDAASLLVGSGPNRPDKAWAQVYRALDHGAARNACSNVRRLGFPAEIEFAADAFVRLQEARHGADYDPDYRVGRSEALDWIALAADAIRSLRQASRKDRIAFAVLLLFKRR